MARLLVATVPLTGHVNPMVLLVRQLIERGHDVRWYGGARFASTITATGAAFTPMRAAVDWDDRDVERAFPALRGTRGLRRVKAQIREMFIRPMGDQLRDLEALAGEVAPDAIVADAAHLGAAAFAEQHGVPWAGLGISALMIPSRDTAPFGPGFPPAPGRSGRLRNRIMYWLVNRVLFRDVHRAYLHARVAAGLPAGTATYFDVLSPQLFLQPTVPSFEYPRGDLPPQVHFIGPLVPREMPGPDALPPWWGDVADARRRGIPVVLVTQGTLATDPRELIRPTLRALAEERVLVVATTALTVGLGHELPANARVASFVPYQSLLPRVSVMVTNGGYGGVQMALAHGVPLVVAGASEEKPEVAARVAWSGTGRDLRTGRPAPATLRAAVRAVLDDPRYRERAREIADEMARHDAAVEGAALIERLVASRAPVLRDAPPEQPAEERAA